MATVMQMVGDALKFLGVRTKDDLFVAPVARKLETEGESATEIRDNQATFFAKRGKDDETQMIFNMDDTGSAFVLQPVVAGVDKKGLWWIKSSASWKIGDREIGSKAEYVDIYVSDEFDSRITAENIYGDTSVGITKAEIRGFLVDDMLMLQVFLRLNSFSAVLPSDADFTFKYSLLERLKLHVPDLVSFKETAYTPVTVDFGDSVTLNGYGAAMDNGLFGVWIDDSSNVKDGGSSFTATKAMVFFNIAIAVNRK